MYYYHYYCSYYRLENKNTDTVGDKEQGNDHTDLFYSETDEKHL